MDKRVISTEILTEERSVESSLRPVKLAEYVGQDRIKDNLKIYIEASDTIFFKSIFNYFSFSFFY